MPTLIRSDGGTENVTVHQLQVFFRQDHDDHHSAGQSFLMGKRTSNQRMFWSMLRRQCLDFWINLFKDMRDSCLYNDGDIFHRQCLIYCFLPIIKLNLHSFLSEWNLHDISGGSRRDGPRGKPEVLFTTPELYDTHSYHYSVEDTDVDLCIEMITRPASTSGCPNFFLCLI